MSALEHAQRLGNENFGPWPFASKKDIRRLHDKGL